MLTAPLLNDDAPWKERFRAPTVNNTVIAAHAPARGLATSNQTGQRQLYAWDVETGALRQLTDRPGGFNTLAVLSPDGRSVYHLDDAEGNEIGHYVRLPYMGGQPANTPQDITPDMPKYSSWHLGMSRAGNRIGFMAAGSDGFSIYDAPVKADDAIGAWRKIYQARHMSIGPGYTAGGEIALVASSERTGKPEFSLIAFDTATGEQIAELYDGPDTNVELMVTSPVPGDVRVLATTNRTGTETLLIWNPRTGERFDLALEGVSGSVRAFDWSPDGEYLLFRTFEQAVQQLYVYHVPTNHVIRLNYPSGINYGPYFAPTGEIFSHWENSTHPVRLIALDRQTGTITRTVLAASEVPPGQPWKSVSFTSSDGQPIQGWLALPEGGDTGRRGPFPLIFETHGGPESVAADSFWPASQAWLDHGFAYLSLNYRGSTTFGRAFQQKIWGDLGHWELEDMIAARNALVEQGVVDPQRILLTGWSYGGYLTLLALGKRPELWAGGLAGIAIADWAVQYEDSADAIKGYQKAIFGGTPEEKPEQYAASSPITYAENIRAPILIIQGRNDTRTPARPVELYEAKLKALGKPIEVYWFESGHTGAGGQVEQTIHFQELMLKFAYRVLS